MQEEETIPEMDLEPTILKTFAVTLLDHGQALERWVQIDVFEDHAVMYRGTSDFEDPNSEHLVAEETRIDEQCTDEYAIDLASQTLLDMIEG